MLGRDPRPQGSTVVAAVRYKNRLPPQNRRTYATRESPSQNPRQPKPLRPSRSLPTTRSRIHASLSHPDRSRPRDTKRHSAPAPETSTNAQQLVIQPTQKSRLRPLRSHAHASSGLPAVVQHENKATSTPDYALRTLHHPRRPSTGGYTPLNPDEKRVSTYARTTLTLTPIHILILNTLYFNILSY